MEESAAKKARVDAIYSQGMQDVLRLEAAAGGSSPSRARGVAIVQVDINWFRCPICSRLLSPPVFQCKNGHLACGGCRAGQCRKCKRDGVGGSFDARNAVVEDIITVSKFKCPHSGCHGFFTYPDLRAHRGACHHAPCFCAEPDCTFAAPPPRLLRHLAADHSWPAQGVGGGVRQSALGAVTAVSVVCVRAADCAPRYTAALRAGSTSMVAMEAVTSSDRPGEVSVEKLPCVLTVPRADLAAGRGCWGVQGGVAEDPH